MQEITNEEMYQINGGALSYSFINAVTKAFTFVYGIGQAVGSAFRRYRYGGMC